MTLEQLIHNAIGRGEFVHLSVAATGTGFKAVFASSSRAGGYSTGEALHPINAMSQAISAAPMTRKLSARGTALAGEFVKEGHDMHEAVAMAALTDDEALS